MKTLETVENRVLAVLKEYPEARNDDMKLYLLVSKACKTLEKIADEEGVDFTSVRESINSAIKKMRKLF